MNWTKVKVILIILFALINLMLAGVLYSKKTDDSRFSAQTLNEVKEILKNSSIEVDDKFVTAETASMSIPDATPITSFDSAFVKKLQSTAELKENGDFVSENAIVSVYDDVVHFENTDETAGTDDLQDTARKYMENFGIDIGSAAESVSKDGDCTVLKYVQKYKGFDIFGSFAEIRISDSGNAVKSANVNWFEISEKHIQTAETVSAAETLLDFAADKTRGTKACTVKNVETGYTAQSDSAASVRNTQLTPSAKITTDIGSEFFYDIRNPS